MAVKSKDPIDLEETAPGKWEKLKPWEHTVNNIPRLGSPVEFCAAIAAILLIAYLF
jgi:hypothetical protein